MAGKDDKGVRPRKKTTGAATKDDAEKILKAEKTKLKDKKKMKLSRKVQQQKEQKRERREERMKEKTKFTSNKSLPVDEIRSFLREHWLISIIGIASSLLLFTLYLAVDALEERDLSKHPTITDVITFKIKVDRGPRSKLVLGLYGNDCPQTVKNFIMLSTHENGYGYVGSQIFYLLSGRVMMGGDIVKNDGTGGKSALDEPFEQENLKLKHKIRGTLGMVALKNNEDSKLSSQFYLTLGDFSSFDGQSVVFGHLLDGLHFLASLERIPVDENMMPAFNVTIASATHEKF